MRKRTARGRAVVAEDAERSPQIVTGAEELPFHLVQDGSDDSPSSDAGDSSDEALDGATGLAGLDAIIRASRQGRAGRDGGTKVLESEDLGQPAQARAPAEHAGPQETSDLRRGPASPHGVAGVAERDGSSEPLCDASTKALDERRRSGRLASSSLIYDDAFVADAGSDSSEDERMPRNTIGDVPLEWYRDEDHIGYDRDGQAIQKRGKSRDALDAVVDRNDAAGRALRTIYDPYNDEELVLSREELRTLLNIRNGRLPEVSVEPHEELVDWVSNEVDPFPMRSAPEPKRRFMPSKHEERKVLKLVRAIRRGWIKPRAERDAPQKGPPVYLLWNDDGVAAGVPKTASGLSYVPAPKPDLPGHEESYNPPGEYLPSEEQKASYAMMDEDDLPEWVPRRFNSLREVPQYDRFMHERFERCLDLYLCPRARSKRLNLKPDDLVPQSLPKPSDLRPFPNSLCMTYGGHQGKVRSVSPSPSGQWLLTGSDDGSMRLWEVLTGRCTRVWDLGARVAQVAWCPSAELPIASAIVANRAVLVPVGVGGGAAQAAAERALVAPEKSRADSSGSLLARWEQRADGGLDLVHSHPLRRIAWHGRGDYFATVAPSGASRSVVVHQLSTRSSQAPFRKNRGRVVACAFHPARPLFLVALENNVRIYNLAKQTLTKKLLAGGGAISCLAVHPSGDHVLVGTDDRRCLWFDLDLSSKPYKVMKYHESPVTAVHYHARYPLFVSASEDATVHIFHGMVYADLMTNPLIVPVKILRAHEAQHDAGVLDAAFHPQQPWIFIAGSDGTARLFVDV